MHRRVQTAHEAALRGVEQSTSRSGQRTVQTPMRSHDRVRLPTWDYQLGPLTCECHDSTTTLLACVGSSHNEKLVRNAKCTGHTQQELNSPAITIASCHMYSYSSCEHTRIQRANETPFIPALAEMLPNETLPRIRVVRLRRRRGDAFDFATACRSCLHCVASTEGCFEDGRSSEVVTQASRRRLDCSDAMSDAPSQ